MSTEQDKLTGSGGAEGRLLSITWPLVVVTALTLSLGLVSLNVLSSLRAYVHGESMWSKGELQAIAALRRFSSTGIDADYQRFRRAIEVPLSDRVARIELLRPHPDYAVARWGLIGGRNDPADVPGMIRLFRMFHDSALFSEALSAWTQGDELIQQLEEVGEQMRSILSGAPGSRTSIEELIGRAERIHLGVAPLEDRYASAIGRTSRQVTRLLAIYLTVCSVLLVAIGAAISRHTLRRSGRREREFAARLQYQATHDALTGLANRREFEHRLSLAIQDHVQHHVEHALLYLDLDQFKVINDTSGHAAGDELIRQVAWSLRQTLRTDDLLARLGGDEFGALLAATSPADALQLAEAVRSRIAGLRFTWEGTVFVVNTSIGVLSLADCRPAVADALSAADQACYLAKDNGRNRVQQYRPDDQQMRARRGEMQWVERLNAALDHDRFVMFAQEICPIGDRGPGGASAGDAHARFELLIRLVETDGSLVSPMAFIPAAERYGLMPRIDRWVVSHACERLAQMRSQLGGMPTCMINLSGASVTDESLADFVRAQLAACGLPSACIGFELTETAAIANLARAAHLMNTLRDLGCSIALDDFGSGMSSFAYLRSLPVDFLKIDGEFVKDMAADPIDFAVVEAIQNIARVMRIKTVAEAVENEATLTAALLVGIDFAQGFHLSRPMPLDDLLQARQASGPTEDTTGRALAR